MSDRLIIDSDTLSLTKNPLSVYLYKNAYKKTGSLRNYLFPKGEETISVCSGCWRGYIATWRVQNDSLFLTEIKQYPATSTFKITDSNYKELQNILPARVLRKIKTIRGKIIFKYNFESKIKSKIGAKLFTEYIDTIKRYTLFEETQKTNLQNTFPDNYSDGKVFANWFSGTLSIPSGKLLNYVHLDYNSTYQANQIYTVENGKIVDKFKLQNNSDFFSITAIYYLRHCSVSLPKYKKDQSDVEYAKSDTLALNQDSTESILATLSILDSAILFSQRKTEISKLLDSAVLQYKLLYNFGANSIVKYESGIGSYIDGYNEKSKERIRVLVLLGFYNKFTLIFKSKAKSQIEIDTICNYIANSVEFWGE